MTETVIVYRSRSEEAIDQMLYGDAGLAAWIIPIIGALVVGGLAGYLTSLTYDRSFRAGRRYVNVPTAVGTVVGVMVAIKLAAPLM